MQLPPKHLWHTLDPQVKALYWLGALANENPTSKRLMGYFHRYFTDHWIGAVAARAFYGEHNIPRDRPVLMVCNHRTFFDYFLAISRLMVLWDQPPAICFPVRSATFYEKPVGGLLNAAVAGDSMYPPIFRKDAKGVAPESRKALNRYSVERCVSFLNAEGPAILGFHPEGRRNQSSDPYDLLPPRPGAGEIAYRARATVLPAFITNVHGEFVGQVKRRFKRQEGPVRVHFGSAIDLDDLYDQPVPDGETRSPVFDEILDRMMMGILKLGESDRAQFAPELPPLDLENPSYKQPR